MENLSANLQFFESISLSLLHSLWLGCIITVLATTGFALLRRVPNMRYLWGVICLLMLAACPLVTFLWIHQPPSNNQSTVVSQTAAVTSSLVPHIATVAATSTFPDDHDFVLNPSAAAHVAVVGVWLLGQLVIGCRLLVSARFVHRLKRLASPVQQDMRRVAERLARRLGVRCPHVVSSKQVAGAMAVGFVRQTIVVPTAWLTDLTPEMLEAVIAHEIAHIRRCDLWVNLIQRLIESILFFHPAVWWLSRRIREDRELCCDLLAVQATNQRRQYAETLERIARQKSFQDACLVTRIGDDRMSILRRVHGVLGQQSSPAAPGWWPMGVLAIVIVCGVMWLSRCFPSFAEETNGLPENVDPLAQVFTEAVVLREKGKPLPPPADEKADGADPSPGSGIAPAPRGILKEVFPWKNEPFQNRIPIMGPMTSGGQARAIDPPTVDQILEVIRFSPPGLLSRVDRKNVVVERIADYVDPPKKYPLIGLAQLHHAHYKCIVTLREDGTDVKKDEQDQSILFVDHTHLHVCEELTVSQDSPAEDEPRRRQRQPNEQTFPMVYDVGDLVFPLAPPVFSVTGEPIPAANAEPDFEALEDLIRSTIAPHSWDRVGGPGALERFETNRSLVVSQTQAVHDEIADLLAQIRGLQELRVVLHATTLEVPIDLMKKQGLFGKRHAVLTAPEQKRLLGAASRDAYARTFPEMKAQLFNGQMMNFELDDDLAISVQGIVKADQDLQLNAVLMNLESNEVIDSPVFTGEQALLVRMSTKPKAIEKTEFRLITAEVSKAKPVHR